MAARAIPRALLAFFLLTTLSGCYTYQRASVADLGPGQDVRVRVTGAYSDTLGPILLTDDARLVEGAVVSREDASLMLEVPVSSELQGMRLETLSQRVQIPTSELVDVETKELSKGRTYGAIGAVVALAAAIVVTQLSGDSGGGSIPGGGGPVESVVSAPGVSLPLTVLFGR